MGIPTIENGQFPWADSVEALLNYVTPGQGDGIATFGDARTRLNAAATSLGLPTIGNDTTAQKRAKINDIIEALEIPTDADMYLDFLNGRYFNGTPTDTHATDILALGSGGYETFGPNVLPRTDLGLLTTVGRTNKCANWNANPTDLTGVSKAGDAAAILTVVDDSAALAAAGLSSICTSGMVFKLDNSAGTSNAIIGIGGGTGNINQHVSSVYARGNGGIKVWQSGAYSNMLTADYQRFSESFTPPNTAHAQQIGALPGAVVYFILNQLEEGTFATDPIITEGSAVTRPGNRPVIDLTGRLSEGVAGVYQMNWLAIESFRTQLRFSDGSPENYVNIEIGSGGGPRWAGASDGASQGVGAIAGESTRATGLITVAFGASNGFRSLRVVGDIQRTDPGKPLPPGMNMMGIGGLGV